MIDPALQAELTALERLGRDLMLQPEKTSLQIWRGVAALPPRHGSLVAESRSYSAYQHLRHLCVEFGNLLEERKALLRVCAAAVDQGNPGAAAKLWVATANRAAQRIKQIQDGQGPAMAQVKQILGQAAAIQEEEVRTMPARLGDVLAELILDQQESDLFDLRAAVETRFRPQIEAAVVEMIDEMLGVMQRSLQGVEQLLQRRIPMPYLSFAGASLRLDQIEEESAYEKAMGAVKRVYSDRMATSLFGGLMEWYATFNQSMRAGDGIREQFIHRNRPVVDRALREFYGGYLNELKTARESMLLHLTGFVDSTLEAGRAASRFVNQLCFFTSKQPPVLNLGAILDPSVRASLDRQEAFLRERTEHLQTIYSQALARGRWGER